MCTHKYRLKIQSPQVGCVALCTRNYCPGRSPRKKAKFCVKVSPEESPQKKYWPFSNFERMFYEAKTYANKRPSIIWITAEEKGVPAIGVQKYSPQ